MKITEYENERIEKYTHHTHKGTLYLGKPNTRENLARRLGLFSTLFSFVMKCNYK